jgi:alanine racemase
VTLHAATIADGTDRPTRLTVDLAAIAHNYRVLCAASAPAAVMPVLKANAYGHGLVSVGRHVAQLGAPILGVAYLEEALALRQAGVSTPILVMGGLVDVQIPEFLANDVQLCASSIDKVRAIDAVAGRLGRRARVHLKIDTGMGRIGVWWENAPGLIEAAYAAKNVVVEGVFSHFATADERDLAWAETQRARFDRVLGWWTERGLQPPTRHLCNSGGLLQVPGAKYDLTRPGILLYGVYPSDDVPRALDVRPALRWTTRVTYFKVVRPGSPVGYGATWVADRPTRVVTLPVGYGDGYLRAMSGKAEVLIRGRRYPVIGRIAMDQIMVSIGDGEAYNGDEVTLVGADGGERITVEDLARQAGTIPHEVLTAINTRVPRYPSG